MKKVLLVAALVLAASAAKADGFICETHDGVLKIKAFDQVQPELGTRNPAVLILSDNTVQYGRKTIATFASEQTLDGSAANYVARVDLRYNNSNTKGEYLLGTRLGELKTVAVDVEFSFASPVAKGRLLSGLITATKRNGQVIEQDLECTRYLKQ